MNEIKTLRQLTSLNQLDFSNKYLIPLDILINWEEDTISDLNRYKSLKNTIINEYKNEFIDMKINNLLEKRKIDDKFIHSIKYALNKLINSDIVSYIDDVVLYGSLARGNNRSNSDIDILLVLDESVKNIANYQKVINKLRGSISTSNINDPENDLHVVYGNDYKKINNAYYSNILKDGISLWN